MTSSEADRFMLEHPEVAVRALNHGQWEAWAINDLNPQNSDKWIQGWGRNGAIANYERMYHSVETTGGDMIKILRRDAMKYYKILKALDHSIGSTDMASFVQEVTFIVGDDLDPTLKLRPVMPLFIHPLIHHPDVVKSALADSAKYRRIVEEYKAYREKVATDGLRKADMYFASIVFSILSDDLKSHCDKCKQELK